MALSYVGYTGDGSNRNFALTFQYISKADVAVLVDGVSVPFTWLSTSLIQTTTAPAPGTFVKVTRTTRKDQTLVDYADASTLTEVDLDLSNVQMLYIAQETNDRLADAITLDSHNQFDAQGRRVVNASAPIAATDLATKAYVDALPTVVLGETLIARDAAEAFKNTASTYAISAGTSATNSANSATASANSATAAANSATAAATSATNSANSATAAATSATNAGTSATNAANSAAAAATSAAAASGSGVLVFAETYGAVAKPLGTAPASVNDCTGALFNAITYLKSKGGGILQLGPGVYGTEGLNIDGNNILIRGVGANITTIMHIASSPGICLNFSAGTGILSNCGVADLAIGSANTTNNKIAIKAGDVSEWRLDNVSIAHYPVDGTLYRGTGGIATGLLTNGRELGKVNNFQCYADKPINIGTNPNASTISLDSWVFSNLLLYAGSTSNAVIRIDTGVVLTNVIFNGHQNWMGGSHGMAWVGASASISSGLYISGVKSEQAFDHHGYTFAIQGGTLYNLSIRDCMLGDRNGINLQNVPNVKIENVFYDAGTAIAQGADGYGLVVNSTVKQIVIDACAWTSGTLGSISGVTAKGTPVFVTGFSVQLPSCGVYTI